MIYAAKRNKNRCPTHPGALLRDDIIPATGRTKAEIAVYWEFSRQHPYDILGERKPVSPAIAVRLADRPPHCEPQQKLLTSRLSRDWRHRMEHHREARE